MDRVTGALFVEGRFGTDERNAVSIFKRSIIYIILRNTLHNMFDVVLPPAFFLIVKRLKSPWFLIT